MAMVRLAYMTNESAPNEEEADKLFATALETGRDWYLEQKKSANA